MLRFIITLPSKVIPQLPHVIHVFVIQLKIRPGYVNHVGPGDSQEIPQELSHAVLTDDAFHEMPLWNVI